MAGKFARAAHLWREKTQIELRVKRWHKKYEILNNIESHNFGLNYVLFKSNRTALQTYKVEERTFGTPCKCFTRTSLYLVRLKISEWIIFLRRHYAGKFTLNSGKLSW